MQLTLPPAAVPSLHDLDASLAVLSIALDERDTYTNHHCDRVCRLAVQLGQACGMEAPALSDLALAARFHDIGKIGIPDAVLLKPGRLDEDEMEIMRSHPLRGERVFLATGREDAASVARLIRQHHEAWNGGGYPDGLGGEEIELGARILAIIDGYDAMITHRPYRTGMPLRRVMDILGSESGLRLDPSLVRLFADLIEKQAAPTA